MHTLFGGTRMVDMLISNPSPRRRWRDVDPGLAVGVRILLLSFSDGDPPGGAECQLICEEGAERLCVEAVIEFIQEIIDEMVVMGRERSVWLTVHKPLPPRFIASTEIEAKQRRLLSVRSWKGRYNWEQARST